MKAIRGAVTVAADTPEEIRGAVDSLLSEIRKRNKINVEDIVCIMLSSTGDITSLYPAKAARECGFVCPLFSSLEPPIKGSLPLCIRAMVLAETDIAVPVYLRGAAILRRDLTERLVIALDGPAGSGKSTAARNLARELDILCLDTGAMYRACALACREAGVAVSDEDAVCALIGKTDLRVEYRDGRQVTMLGDRDVSEEIRSPGMSQLASEVSALACVRSAMVAMQRRIASEMSCVLDGRDIGTNVLPDARYKFFVTASDEVRARRRLEEDRAKGYDVRYEDVLCDIRERDRRDSERAIAPLKCAEDAVVVDTSDMSPEEVVQFIRNKIQEKI